jgi:hypothetical protein
LHEFCFYFNLHIENIPIEKFLHNFVSNFLRVRFFSFRFPCAIFFCPPPNYFLMVRNGFIRRIRTQNSHWSEINSLACLLRQYQFVLLAALLLPLLSINTVNNRYSYIVCNSWPFYENWNIQLLYGSRVSVFIK